MRLRRARATRFCGVLLGVVPLAAACASNHVVGEWTCAEPIPDQGFGGEGNETEFEEITLPWSTGFEDGFCGYARVHGFCKANPSASYALTRSPVRSGRFAAAFSVDSSVPEGGALQARCTRRGVLPREAYYGAWFFVLSAHANADNWNLFHFRRVSADTVTEEPGLWDVSLIDAPTGSGMILAVFDFLRRRLEPGSAPPVPIGSWFHVQVFLRRAADAAGEVTVFQDGVIAYRAVDVITDDSTWGEWYVGNLANELSPPKATLYIDDITITATP